MKKVASMKFKIPEPARTAWQYISRSPWLTLVSIFTMALTFFIISVLVTVAAGSNFVLDYLESRAQFAVFFEDEVSEEEILTLKKSLEEGGNVSEVEYISKEEALKIYSGQHQDEPSLLESISANIFPASLVIRAKNIKMLPTLAKQFEGREGVEEVIFFEDVADTFRRWSEAVRLAGGGLIIILVLISVSFVLITIGMTIHTKKEEIEIMKLIGAADSYINLPFLLQGAFYGVAAATLSTLLFGLSLTVILPRLYSLFRPIPLPSPNPLFFATLFSGEIAFGVFLGALGSFGAIRKYLRV